MKAVVISDTHNKHHELKVKFPSYFKEEYDFIFHAGDISGFGSIPEINDFLTWFSSLDNFKHKVFIAGNHDWGFEKTPSLIKPMIPDNVIYLEDSMVEIERVKIWGSPQSPRFFNWAFNRDRGEDIRRYWDMIPDDIDIVITHSPPFGAGDYVVYTHESVGCKDLTDTIHRVKPKYHLSGHVHGGYGVKQLFDTICVNGSSVNEQYRIVNEPIVIEF